MATVDLDKLSAELTNEIEGFIEEPEDDEYIGRHITIFGGDESDCPDEDDYAPYAVCYSNEWLYVTENGEVFPGSEFEQIYDNRDLLTHLYPVLDIIRRHVAPVAPDPGLREAIADVLLPKESVGAFPPNYRQEVLDKADEIIAVLAERGVR